MDKLLFCTYTEAPVKLCGPIESGTFIAQVVSSVGGQVLMELNPSSFKNPVICLFMF